MKPNVSATGLVLLLATLVAPSALAAPRASAGAEAELGAGLWVVEGEGDEPWLAPQVSTEVHLHVDGMIAHARVEQVFDNPSDEAVEAVYVFPVADAAAVDGLSLQVGPRTLSAELRESAAAASAFESAADGGRVAALVARERRDVLSTRVANIPPGATVTVTLRYRQLVGAAHGVLSLDVPTTFIPRPGFGSAEGIEGARAAGAGERVAARLAPPVALDGSGPLFDVWVELERGAAPGSVESTTHAIDVAPHARGLAVRLSEGPVVADRDFVLRWRPPSGEGASASVTEQIGGQRYLLATLPAPLGAAERLHSATGSRAPSEASPRSRDITFVVDTSRSMAGAALTQATAALGAALARLTPLDHFNVIEATSPPRPLFEQSRPASALAVAQALERTGALRASGDTALTPALELALAVAPHHPDRSEQVVLISDGDIPDERQLFTQIERELGTRRLYTLGVGPAPGRYALRGAARAGRGTFTSIADVGEVPARVAELDAELGSPTLEGLALVGADAAARLQPELHLGEPLLVLAQLPTGALGVTLTGRYAGEPWQQPIALGKPARNSRLDRLWAWRELERLEAAGPAARGATARLELARRRGLASALTSFVAVDSERSVEQRAPRSAVPLALPAGSEIFGKLPQLPPPGPTCSRDRHEPWRAPGG